MKLRNIDSKKTLKAFQKMGFEIKAQSGTHVIVTGYINGNKKTFPIPIHHKEIPEGTINDIIKREAGITREEFFKYY
ncbi:MAG: type II toxin-antitoxin system HicA family toxin [Nanoarchaeota archaeon]|nr:type II toxin-antitoxin system HicA family toxin [Nanoarchaeota archaeon]